MFRTGLLLLMAFFFTGVTLFGEQVPASVEASSGDSPEELQRRYEEYRQRFESIQKISDIPGQDFNIIGSQVFPVTLETYGEILFIPALDAHYNRMKMRILYTKRISWNRITGIRGSCGSPTRGSRRFLFRMWMRTGLRILC